MSAFAEEAVLTGTITDSTGAVLPGVAVTATNQATGNVFTAVTDETGRYRLPARDIETTSFTVGGANRSAADIRAAGAGTRLDVAGATRARQPHDDDRRRAGDADAGGQSRLFAEPRRPAGGQHARRTQPASL